MDESRHTEDTRFTRRGSLLTLAGLAAAVLEAKTPRAALGAGGPAGVATGAVTCVLTPELTEGPYYLPNEKVRRDITEGRPGTPLALRTTVVDASTCKAIKRAAVDIWHCDAVGVYSGVQGNVGSTFMRGIQRTDSRGLALFKTVYPGWYAGRAVHIHVKVHIGGTVVHTGQLFFPDTLTDAVYKKAPYNKRSARTTRNANDSIFRNGGSRGMLSIHRSGAGYVATITMGVHRS